MAIVFYSKNLNYSAFVDRVFAQFKKEITQATSFLIKPNFVSYESYPTTTHPEMLACVLASLKALGKSDITVADGPAVDAGTCREIFTKHPLKETCVKYNVPLVNLYTTKTKKSVSPRLFPVRIFALPLEKDFVISLPVLKEHTCCGLTGALKNQFGYLPRQERLAFHAISRLGKNILAKGIAEINVVAKPNLVIMDAKETLITAQEIRHGGRKIALGYLLAGIDPVALDSFGLTLLQTLPASRLAGILPEQIAYLKYAHEYGVGSLEYSKQEWS